MNKQNKFAQSDRNFFSTSTAPKFYPKKVDDLPTYDSWGTTIESNKLLVALQQENGIIKEEYQAMVEQMKKSAAIFNCLRTENQKLKSALSQRDKDVQHVIETITVNQTQNEIDLKLQINLYEEELTLASQHIAELKQREIKLTADIEEKSKQLQRAKVLNDQLDQNMQQALKRETDLANQFQLEKIKAEHLTSINEQLKLDEKPLQAKIKAHEINIDELNSTLQSLKSQTSKSISEHTQRFNDLNKKYYKAKSDAQHFQHLGGQQDNLIKDLKEQIQNLQRNDLSSQVLILQQENLNLNNQLVLLQKRLQNSADREKQFHDQYNEIKEQLDQYRHLNIELQVQIDQKAQESTMQNTFQSERLKKQFEQMKFNLQEQISSLQNDVEQERNLNQKLKAQIDDLKLEVDNKQKDIHAYKNKVNDLENLKRQINELRQQLVVKDTEVQSIKENNHELRELNKQSSSDLEEQILNLQEQVRRLNEDIEAITEQNTQLKWYQQQYDELTVQLQNLKIEKDQFKLELHSIQGKVNHQESALEEQKREVYKLEQENRSMRNQIKTFEKHSLNAEKLLEENKLLRQNNNQVEFISPQTRVPYSSNDKYLSSPEEAYVQPDYPIKTLPKYASQQSLSSIAQAPQSQVPIPKTQSQYRLHVTNIPYKYS